ncbi:MAG: hypothetical protein MUO88_24425 [Desulfobacterales bacterium]|nr:hypothetical protein [Desulfobacterales bacterium]
MDKEKLLDLAKDPKYISGIYNYCDRWCERCPFTSRCLNCMLVEEQFGDLREGDEMNAAFWQRFSDMLQDTLAMVKEMAKERGIDLDSIESDNDCNDGDTIEENSLADLISHTSKHYAESVDDWFSSHDYLFYEKEAEFNRIRLAAQNDPVKEAADIKDAIEVIRWYQYQIHVKLNRAGKSAFEEESTDYRDFPKDSDGSAKVALIGIDRSLSAWNILLLYFPEQKAQILNLAALLENIKNRVEIRFPCARDFVRQGFDKIEQNC